MKDRRKRKTARKSQDWLGRITKDSPLANEEFNRETFHDFVNLVVDDAIDMLTEDGEWPTNILALDSSWRALHIFDGGRGVAPARMEPGRQGVVRVRGSMVDSIPTIRQMFTRLDIRAAIFRAEAWSCEPESLPIGLPREFTRANALGRREVLVVEAYFPGADYYRFMECPMVRMGDLVTAGVVDDVMADESLKGVQSSLVKCFPFRTMRLRETT